jgi:hypothetical protein
MKKPKNILSISGFGIKITAHGIFAILALIALALASVSVIAIWPDNAAKLLSSISAVQIDQSINGGIISSSAIPSYL